MTSITLLPSGKTIQAEAGASLRDFLFPEGMEFACGGKGNCRGCRVRVLDGAWEPNEKEKRALPAEMLTQGWRLSCQGKIERSVTLEIAQWEMPILADETPIQFTPGDGLGIAVDLGTTTIAAQLLDLHTGHVLAVASALNAQSVHGSDVMTRLDYALNGGAETLTRKIRAQIGGLINELLEGIPRQGRPLRKVLITGNAAMHHLFSGLPVESLARHPFSPASRDAQLFTSDELSWSRRHVEVKFLPCLGGFVGSDILAGILATGLHRSPAPAALLDLGTNGEIVVSHGSRIVCASAAAGPAFEGARISMGMRAATGAISEVEWRGDQLECRVVRGVVPRGLCGSGLVDAVAVGLDRAVIGPDGRFRERRSPWPIAGRVSLSQRDIRELQLAKSAITTGLLLLCQQLGIRPDALEQVYLAGAFGNYISQRSAQRIGLLPLRASRIVPAGNASLRGAKLALFSGHQAAVADIASRTEHLFLNEHPDFQSTFVDQLSFPAEPILENNRLCEVEPRGDRNNPALCGSCS